MASTSKEKMRTVVARGHGGPQVLTVKEVERPEPRKGEVLIQVRAAGVNPIDSRLRRGDLWPMSALLPGRSQGRDVSGVVAALGEGVSSFEVGTRVYAMLSGISGGAYAEYVTVGEDVVAKMPKNLSSEEAAAVPLAALTALRAVRDALREVAENAPHACDTGELSRRRVLVNGASGGVGTFAVQLAKIFGAEVTAVCSSRNLDLVRDLGADRGVDYEEEDFTRDEGRYDVIFDVVGNRSFRECKQALGPTGIYVTTEPGPRGFLSQVLTLPSRKKARVVVARPSGRDLSLLRDLFEAGRLRVVLDQVYPLEEVSAAHDRAENGHPSGKVVLKVGR